MLKVPLSRAETTFIIGSHGRRKPIRANSGLIEWTPDAPGDFTVTVQAANGVNPPAQQSFTVQVSDAAEPGAARLFLPVVAR